MQRNQQQLPDSAARPHLVRTESTPKARRESVASIIVEHFLKTKEHHETNRPITRMYKRQRPIHFDRRVVTLQRQHF
jgi:hypothetical protein